MKVYLNGAFVEESSAVISIDDRAFLFADGVYEVVHVYHGRYFLLDEHLARLQRSLDGIGIQGVSPDDLREPMATLLGQFEGDEGALYVQISRGTQRRSHAPPAPGTITPTVLMWVRPVDPIPHRTIEDGVSLITVADDRWAKVWIKTVGLLPNVLAKGKAQEASAFDAIFVRDGMVTESTSANLFRVQDGVLETAPVTNYILPGITRDLVLKLAAELKIPVRLLPFTPEQLKTSDEAFLTGTLTEVLPVTQVDGVRISDTIGPLTQRLLEGLQERAGK